MRKAYIDGPNGQVHVRTWGNPNSPKPALICLPPSPYSSVSYMTLAPLLADDRHVIAVDYPGYGLSDSLTEPSSIQAYASAVQAVISSLSNGKPANLIGFHSGCLVACETALTCPQAVNSLILIDVPYFVGESRDNLLKQTTKPVTLQTDILMLEPAWKFTMGLKQEQTPLSRAFEMFVDQISTGEDMNAAFHAAFTYKCDERLALLNTPTTIIATQSSLLDGSRQAAETIPSASIVEQLDITASVLEASANKTAESIKAVLAD